MRGESKTEWRKVHALTQPVLAWIDWSPHTGLTEPCTMFATFPSRSRQDHAGLLDGQCGSLADHWLRPDPRTGWEPAELGMVPTLQAHAK